MTRRTTLAVAIGAAVVLAGGAARAVSDGDQDPTPTDEVVVAEATDTTGTTESAPLESPTESDGPGGVELPDGGAGSGTTGTTEGEEIAEEPAGAEGPVNHGGAVSAVARDTTLQGREHGEAVSEVARDKTAVAPVGSGGAEDGEAADDGASEAEAGPSAGAGRGPR
jgi:hypothetical protein